MRPQGIPIIIGGFSDAAVRRAAALGDGWQSLYLDGQGSDPDDLARKARWLKEQSHGRVQTSIKRYVRNSTEVEHLVEEIPDWERAGADDLVVWFGEPAVFAALQNQFARQARIGK